MNIRMRVSSFEFGAPAARPARPARPARLARPARPARPAWPCGSSSLFSKSAVRNLQLTILLAFVVILTGCAREQAIPKGQIIGCDDLGRKIVLPKSPERIVVISSSPVDAIFELGAGERIVAVQDSIARSYPETVRRYPSLLEKPGVGKFSNPNIEKIVSLNPDLIIPYGSSDSPGKYTEVFEKRGLPYAAFTTVEDVAFGLEQIKRLGVLLGKEKEAENLAGQIKSEIDDLAGQISSQAKSRPLVYYWWGSGNGTYGNRAAINELIELAGGINLAGEFDRQYMELSPEYVISRNPDVIIISYWQEEQQEARVEEIKTRPGFSEVKAVKNNRIYTIDGHSFHTPVRFAEAIHNLASFIHPEVKINAEKAQKGIKDQI
ncbi:MAG: ABC transporter substrate-binding protein [bacterium]|nr:ABC transporter substrate-binding protein [bacterium]